MKILFYTIFLGISINLMGQVHYIGIQGGINYTNVSANEIFRDAEFKSGFIGGFNYTFLLSNKFILESSLLYSERGFIEKIYYRDEHGIATGEDNIYFYYNYLSFPLKFGYIFQYGIKLTPKIGLSPSFLIKAKLKSRAFNDSESDGEEIIIFTDRPSKFDLSGIIELELGYEFYDYYELFSSIMYSHSFTNFSDSDYFNEIDMKHYGISVSFGARFKLYR